MKKLLVVALMVIIAIVGFACSKDNPVGPGSTSGVIVLQDNSTSGNPTNPTGSPGTKFLQIGSFCVIGNGGEAEYKITFKDDRGVPMGVNCQNLVLWNNFGPLGTTKGDLNTSPGKYTFTLDPTMNLIAGVMYSFQLYVDIKNSAEVDKFVPSLQLYSITTIDVANGKVREYLNQLSFLPIHIVSYYDGQKG